MELDNEDVLLGMTIAAVILGIGLSMFLLPNYTGYGAVVLAIGMMTLALMITARPKVIERVKREVVFQPARRAEPAPITPPTIVIPSPQPSTQAAPESQKEEASTTTAVTEPTQTQETIPLPPQEAQSTETQTVESQPTQQPQQPQPEEKPPEKKEEEQIPATPS